MPLSTPLGPPAMAVQPSRFTGAEVRKMIGKARAHGVYSKGVMNATERAYRSHLDAQKLVGQVLRYDFEKLTLKIGDDCRLTVDFMVVHADYTISMDDVKGTKRNKSTGKQGYYAEGDAMVKMRAAAEQFPQFLFRVAWLTSEGWQTKEIGA